MRYNVNDTIRIVTDDTSGYGKGYIGKITNVDDTEDFTVYYEVDGRYEYCESEIELVKHSRIRGFEVIKGYCDVTLPTRATRFSAGYDIASAIDITIVPNATVVIPTGIKAYMQGDEFLGLYIRSSMGKMGLTMSTSVSVIDSDYFENQDNDGHIMILLRNDSSFPIDVAKGTRLVQGIFHTFGIVDSDNVNIQRTGGTGSSGK